jgi:hypothetical protein
MCTNTILSHTLMTSTMELEHWRLMVSFNNCLVIWSRGTRVFGAQWWILFSRCFFNVFSIMFNQLMCILINSLAFYLHIPCTPLLWIRSSPKAVFLKSFSCNIVKYMEQVRLSNGWHEMEIFLLILCLKDPTIWSNLLNMWMDVVVYGLGTHKDLGWGSFNNSCT